MERRKGKLSFSLTDDNLDRVIEGDLDDIVTALRNHYQAELLASQSEP